VTLVLRSDGSTLDLVVTPGVRKRLWTSGSSPGSCSATRGADAALRFECSEDLASISGKLYVSGDKLVVGVATSSGLAHEQIQLPCGAKVTFAITCPATCTLQPSGGPETCACSVM
jgi:hypothetical protein